MSCLVHTTDSTVLIRFQLGIKSCDFINSSFVWNILKVNLITVISIVLPPMSLIWYNIIQYVMVIKECLCHAHFHASIWSLSWTIDDNRARLFLPLQHLAPVLYWKIRKNKYSEVTYCMYLGTYEVSIIYLSNDPKRVWLSYLCHSGV